jgi:hypothetical protein
VNEKIHRPYTRELTQNWLYIADESLIYILLGKKKVPCSAAAAGEKVHPWQPAEKKIIRKEIFLSSL